MEVMVDVCLGPRRPGGSDGWCMFRAQETRWK